jgi:hypothetical protein
VNETRTTSTMNPDETAASPPAPQDVPEDQPRAEGRPDAAAPTTEDIANANAAKGAPATKDDDVKAAPLFDRHAATELHDQWDEIQAGFVDEPRSAVEKADALVADVMKRLAESFANERRSLEDQWSRGDDVSTEDLRIALRRYRSFFDRLLSM